VTRIRRFGAAILFPILGRRLWVALLADVASACRSGGVAESMAGARAEGEVLTAVPVVAGVDSECGGHADETALAVLEVVLALQAADLSALTTVC